MGDKSRTQRSPDGLNPEDLSVLVADPVYAKGVGVTAQYESVTQVLANLSFGRHTRIVGVI
ncbi:MAG TPA: hypothetical protein DIC52_11280 [Candidatus Latescibacteria bacterium]|nr:hypothetical protein [Candidatus Latescibacterota bacterium]